MDYFLDLIETITDTPARLANAYSKWGDLKKKIFENILIYLLMMVIFLFFDLLVNALAGHGVKLFQHELSHPVNFGKGQLLGFVFSFMQFVRNLSQYRYVS